MKVDINENSPVEGEFYDIWTNVGRLVDLECLGDLEDGSYSFYDNDLEVEYNSKEWGVTHFRLCD